jgi:hypothetical protein
MMALCLSCCLQSGILRIRDIAGKSGSIATILYNDSGYRIDLLLIGHPFFPWNLFEF